MNNLQIPIINLQHDNTDFYICKLKGKTIADISYVARRREVDEEGAVQRILTKSRISKIKDFLLAGGYFPNNIILNFTNSESVTINSGNSADLIPELQIAQIIDGQHRVEGLKEAIKSNSVIGDVEFPVLFAINLTTAKCAEIFISINTEQKVVPKSLIYDLYGLLNIPHRDFSIDRATDIAQKLNTEDNSPYQGYIKFPNSKKSKGGIQLSSVVNNLKQLVKENGEFAKYSIHTLEAQTNILINYFNALSYFYGKNWDNLKNPFLFAAGFGAAIDVLESKLLPFGYSKKKFTEEFFKNLITLEDLTLPLQEEVKGLSGETARETIREKLIHSINIHEHKEDEFEI